MDSHFVPSPLSSAADPPTPVPMDLDLYRPQAPQGAWRPTIHDPLPSLGPQDIQTLQGNNYIDGNVIDVMGSHPLNAWNANPANARNLPQDSTLAFATTADFQHVLRGQAQPFPNDGAPHYRLYPICTGPEGHWFAIGVSQYQTAQQEGKLDFHFFCDRQNAENCWPLGDQFIDRFMDQTDPLNAREKNAYHHALPPVQNNNCALDVLKIMNTAQRKWMNREAPFQDIPQYEHDITRHDVLRSNANPERFPSPALQGVSFQGSGLFQGPGGFYNPFDQSGRPSLFSGESPHRFGQSKLFSDDSPNKMFTDDSPNKMFTGESPNQFGNSPLFKGQDPRFRGGNPPPSPRPGPGRGGFGGR